RMLAAGLGEIAVAEQRNRAKMGADGALLEASMRANGIRLRWHSAFNRILTIRRAAGGFGFPVAVRPRQSPATECGLGKPCPGRRPQAFAGPVSYRIAERIQLRRLSLSNGLLR